MDIKKGSEFDSYLRSQKRQTLVINVICGIQPTEDILLVFSQISPRNPRLGHYRITCGSLCQIFESLEL